MAANVEYPGFPLQSLSDEIGQIGDDERDMDVTMMLQPVVGVVPSIVKQAKKLHDQKIQREIILAHNKQHDANLPVPEIKNRGGRGRDEKTDFLRGMCPNGPPCVAPGADVVVPRISPWCGGTVASTCESCCRGIMSMSRLSHFVLNQDAVLLSVCDPPHCPTWSQIHTLCNFLSQHCLESTQSPRNCIANLKRFLLHHKKLRNGFESYFHVIFQQSASFLNKHHLPTRLQCGTAWQQKDSTTARRCTRSGDAVAPDGSMWTSP
jgi:hypothetical protein